MAHKVIIPEDITEPGKEFLRSKGYEVVVVDGKQKMQMLYLPELQNIQKRFLRKCRI